MIVTDAELTQADSSQVAWTVESEIVQAVETLRAVLFARSLYVIYLKSFYCVNLMHGNGLKR